MAEQDRGERTLGYGQSRYGMGAWRWDARCTISCGDSTGSEGAGGDQLTPLEAGTLAAVACGAVWTERRRCDAGYTQSPLCPLCQQEDDSLWHRAWRCPCSSEVRRRWATDDQIRRAVEAGPTSPLWSGGWYPLLSQRHPPPSESACMRAFVHGRGEVPLEDFRLSGCLSLDGSCTTAPVREECRASWAVVQFARRLGPDGGLVRLRSLTGLVPAAWPQTPQAAEFAATVACAQHLVPPGGETVPSLSAEPEEDLIYTDCLGVQRLYTLPVVEALQHSRVWAGARRLAMTFHGAAERLAGMRKVKAHQTHPVANETESAAVARMANDWADEEAKQARSRHPRPSTVEAREANQAWCDALVACHVLARATLLWPPPPSRDAAYRAARATTR